MKRVMLGLTLVMGLLSSTGCHLLSNKHCSDCNGNIGCRPCRIGWQRGGTDYQRFLGHSGQYCEQCNDGSCNANGVCNGNAAGHGHHGAGHFGRYAKAAPPGALVGEGAAPGATGGPATAQVAYPYYTNRGPRDFLNPNPPSIGP